MAVQHKIQALDLNVEQEEVGRGRTLLAQEVNQVGEGPLPLAWVAKD
jgi:hypothetical protein